MRVGKLLLLAVLCAVPIEGAIGQAASPATTRQVREAGARTLPRLGDTVVVAGRVTLGWGVLDTAQLNFHMQDSSGGVLVDADRSPLRLIAGDSVVVRGVIGRQRGGVPMLDDATVTLVPGTPLPAIPLEIGELLPTRLAELESRLVTAEGFVVTANVRRGDDLITLGDSAIEGNYLLVRDAANGLSELKLARFSLGDRVRVTGVLTKRQSQSGATRYTLLPRSVEDVAPLGLTAKRKAALLWQSAAALAVLLGAALTVVIQRKRARDRRHALQALRDDATRYRSLVFQAPVGIVVHRDGRIILANCAFRRFIGVQNVDGADILDLTGPGERQSWAEGLGMDAGAPDVPGSATRQLTRPDGTIVQAEITNGAITYEGLACVQSVIYDVTERTRAERALAESEGLLRQAQKLEAVGQLAAGVAHDFNNILTAIKGNAGFLLEGCAKCGEIAPEAGEINDAADRAAALTSQLLAFSRKQVSKPKVVELDAVVRNLEPMLRRLLPANLDQVVEFDATHGHLFADPSQLEQIIVNLVVNARDAMRQGGQITLRTSNAVVRESAGARDAGRAMKPGTYLLLTVSDTGVGMDDETRRRAFEPFFTTKEMGKGTGLGLSTVYGIVQQCDGYIFIDSAPGAGTTFAIYLPRVDAAEGAEPEADMGVAPASGTETILIVEDEPAIRSMMARTLEREGYAVLVAEDGMDALARVRRHQGRLDLLLTDVVMPGLSGSEIAAHLTKVRRGLRVLYMSGYTGQRLSSLGVGTLDVELLEKPFSPRELLERVRNVLDNRAVAA